MTTLEAGSNRVALALLAAGRGSRFGGDKLMAPLAGRPLLAYAACLGEKWRWGLRLAVVDAQGGARGALLRAKGWHLQENSEPARGQGSSLALAAQRAAAHGCSGLLICLADMPAVEDGLLAKVLSAATDSDAVVCTSGAYHGPPTYFAGRHLPQLASCEADRAGAALLRGLPWVKRLIAPPEQLMDVDTPAALQALEEQWGRHRRD